ncbi:MAG: CinA family nicotinamide mononucleotide deamidase-related protein, partial [Dehalococcoidia bacterium]|nr:CinA family nicotinamide mononucleotide deamidase-related protein [Dehalococcoidia bacterium]
NRSDLVLTTGGLGPTEDDLTREAIAALMGEEPRVDPELEQGLREFFSRRGYQMPESNIKQATIIPSAQVIPNPRGTAPGWWVERDGKVIIAMPGPPSEMQRMWEKEVSQRLRQKIPEIILSRTLKTYLLAEAAVGELVSPYLSSTNPTLAVYAKPDGIQLRLTAKAENKERAEQMIAQLEERVRALLGDVIWGCDDETLESVVGALLTEKGLSLAAMESCTGGLLASTITDVPGSSNYFKGGLVAYTNEVKIYYGVDAALLESHGAISPEVACAMAEAARHRLGADIGVGITGVAGPDAVEGKPVGTVYIAIDNGKEKRLIRGTYPPLRHEVKR